MHTQGKWRHTVEKLQRRISTLDKSIEWILDFVFPLRSSEMLWRQENALERLNLCARAETSLDHTITALFAYRDPLIQSLIWDLKYRGNKYAVHLCAQMLFDALAEELADRKLFTGGRKAILIPIPLSQKREQSRGFNQAALLVRALARIDMKNFFSVREDVLKKIKNTKPQAELSREERLQNLRGVFTVQKPQIVRGHTIILIDDVTTTGATIREARRVLRNSGAREVLAFVVAH